MMPRRTRPRRPYRLVLFSISLIVLISGCETRVERGVELPAWFSGETGPAAHASSPAASPSPAHAAIHTPAATPPPAPSPQASNTIGITLKDFKLEPSEVTARAGKVTFVLKNEGRYTHNFHVEGQGVDWTGPKFGPGRTHTVELALEAGEYRISCPVSNHDQRGMVGKLVVRP